MKLIIKKIIFFFLYPLKLIIKPKKIIIFSSSTPNRYAGGPKVLFEYLSSKKLYCFWWTSNIEIKKYIKKKNFRSFSYSSFIIFFKVLFGAKIVIDSGDDHFDFCGLIAKDKRVIKINLGHGSGPKMVNHNNIYTLSKKFNFVSYPSNFSKKKIGIKEFKVPEKNINIFGNPKNDVFFEKIKNKRNRNIAEKILGKKIKNNEKTIFYAPTWRPYKYDLPILKIKNFNFKKFNLFLIKNNFYFFYNCHVQSFFLKKQDFSNIKFINQKKNPLFDPNDFIREIDIFCTDCSTLSTEASIANVPQIILFPDLKYYNNVKGFVEKFENIIPGKFIFSYQDFEKCLIKFSNKRAYLKRFKNKIDNYLLHYYDINIKNSKKLHYKFIENYL